MDDGKTLLGATVVLACAAWTAGLSASTTDRPLPEVIYGEDDRRDVFDPSNSPMMVELARSTAVLVRAGELRPHPSNASMSTLPTTTFGSAYNLCSDEPFREQPNPGFCSGFLVAPDVLVTAGHCIESASECGNTAFVFDFGYLNSANDRVTDVPASNIFRCRELIKQAYSGGTTTDYAVVRLDRVAEGRQPLSYRSEGRVAVGTELTVIGHPAGLPTKISGGARVRTSDTTRPFFVANLDTYGGNSGSAVFNTQTGEVEGILVRGETDFTNRGSCRTSYRCQDNACRGEDVTRATEFAPWVNAAPTDPTQPTRPTRDVTVTAQGLPLPIPDNNTSGVEIPFNFGAEGTVGGISVAANIEHSYIGDLSISLVNPEGLEVVLHDNAGGATGNLNAVWGAGGINVADLDQFHNASAEGQWKIIVRDTATDDTGSVVQLALTLKVHAD